MLIAKSVLGVGATLLSLPFSSASSICSSAPYKGYLRLSRHPAAESYCSTHYPQLNPTQTSTITQTVIVSTIKSTITPDPITVTAIDSFITTATETDVPTTTAVKRDVVKKTSVAVAAHHWSLLFKLKRQPKPFIKTVCSCIEHTPTVTETAISTATVLVTLAPVVVTTTTSTATTTTTTTTASASTSPDACTYTASCSDVINGILDTNSIVSPQLVDYRMQSALLGITSPSEFLAALGPDPCQQYDDPTEHDICVQLLANSDFVSQLTDVTTRAMNTFDNCASNYASGGQDYQIVLNDPSNANCTRHDGMRRRVKRPGDDHDLTAKMLQGIEHYMAIAPAPVLGPKKSGLDLIQLARRQQSTCARTGTCFETCPDCRDEQTYCGTQATVLATGVCAAAAAVVNAAVQVLAAAACTSACAPLGPLAAACGAFCAKAAGGLSAAAVGATCAVVRNEICTPLTQRCANCNSANNGICDANSAQCCPGETGTQCGNGCCCCPVCQAPGGINCACTAAPC